jgi:hypothetical protein
VSLKFVTRGGKYHYVFWDQPEGAPKEDAHSKHTDPYKAAQRATEIFTGDPNATIRIELDTITDVTMTNVTVDPPPPDEPVPPPPPPPDEPDPGEATSEDLIQQILDVLPTVAPSGEIVVIQGFQQTMAHWASEATDIRFRPLFYGLDGESDPMKSTHIGVSWKGFLLFFHWRNVIIKLFNREAS